MGWGGRALCVCSFDLFMGMFVRPSVCLPACMLSISFGILLHMLGDRVVHGDFFKIPFAGFLEK